MKIEIGAQYGGPTGDKYFWPLHYQLNQVFEKHLKGPYFKTFNEFGIAFRVSGKITDFGFDGPERMKKLRSKPGIGIDLSFPESSWKGVEEDKIREKIISGVLECLRLMTQKAKAMKELTDLNSFQRDLEKVFSEITGTDFKINWELD